MDKFFINYLFDSQSLYYRTLKQWQHIHPKDGEDLLIPKVLHLHEPIAWFETLLVHAERPTGVLEQTDLPVVLRHHYDDLPLHRSPV